MQTIIINYMILGKIILQPFSQLLDLVINEASMVNK